MTLVLKALVGIVLGTDSRFYTIVAVLLDTFVAVAALLIALMGAIGAVMTVFHGTPVICQSPERGATAR